MLIRRLIFGGIALSALIFLLFRPPVPGGEEQRLVEQQFPAMGTWFTVSVWLDEPGQREAARGAIGAAEQHLHAYARQWDPNGDGALGGLNQRLAAGESITVPADMQPLFRAAEQWRRDSDGAFDARIGTLITLWGFDDAEDFRTRPPAEAERAARVEAIGAAPVYDGIAYGPAPAVRWNFGAIAKGEAVEQASAILVEAGFDHHIVNAGGDLVVRGERGDRKWRVAVRHPRPGMAQSLLAALDVGDEAVFTSGDYERHFEHDGTRYHHIISPATGAPARGLQSVTVVAPEGVAADAASTALFVAGADWRAMADRLGIAVAMVVYDDGSLAMTPAAADRFRLIADVARRDAE